MSGPSPVPVSPPPILVGKTRVASGRGQAVADFLFRNLCLVAASLVLVIAGLLLLMLILDSRLAMRAYGFSFFLISEWDPSPAGDREPVFGALPFIWGTVTTSVIAMLLAVPLGIGSAAYLSEIARPRVRRLASFFVEMLAAIPSVVYGFWGLLVLGPVVTAVFTFFHVEYSLLGKGILSAGLILALMIVPYIIAITYDVCQAVPRSQREGSYALGGTRWQTIWGVVLPYAQPGIVAGAFLALGRALGETMAVTLLIGNVPRIEYSPGAQGSSIASVLANNYTEATGLKASVLVELALVLVLVSVGMNALARVLLWRMGANKPLWLFSFWRRPSARSAERPGGGIPSIQARPASEAIPSQGKHPVRVPLPQRGRSWLSAEAVDRLMTGMLGCCVLFTMALLILILGYLVAKGAGALNWAFFTELPVPINQVGGGLRNAIVGSLVLVSTATAFAVPVGLLAAIYLAEYRNGPLARTVRFVTEMLGGVPSIVVGLFSAALFYVVKQWIRESTGYRIDLFGWSGVLALAVMMVPIVIRASEEALKLVPRSIREASYALGASQTQTVLRVTVPAALPAIVTAIFLSIARIAGETAPLLLTARSSDYDFSTLNDRTPTLPVFIYNYATSSSPYQQQQGWAAAFLLMVVVLLLNFGIRFAAGKRVVQASQAG